MLLDVGCVDVHGLVLEHAHNAGNLGVMECDHEDNAISVPRELLNSGS
jgi:hypothetical protein